MADNTDFLDRLNEAQRRAVEYVDGPSLVIAGAGSGKTMVLTYKIAYLLKLGLRPFTILALTFTNKAAREMKDRIAQLVGIAESASLWMGTFHSICSRILRVEGHVFGFTPSFTIYQPSDTRSLVKAIIKEMGLDDKVYKPQVICNRISAAKNSLILPQEYKETSELTKRDTNSLMPRTAEIYAAYCNRCRQSNAMDFDDMLLYTYLLFAQYPEVRSKYAQRFQYILVDEYQDTNYAQHKILTLLASAHHRICVVGDDAQSIYSFRGADIDNILQFTSQYDNARLFKLEQNYRSTQTIVGAANSLIENNKEQIPKTIFSQNQVGEPILITKAYSDVEEGEIVCRQIRELHLKEHLPYSQFAILYRTNAQSRIFEEVLAKYQVPYRIYGGHSFFDRKEIRDILAYFRLTVNPSDEEAFKRVVNYPARGVGDVTVAKLLRAASAAGVSVWSVAQDPQQFGIKLQNKTHQQLTDFCNLISKHFGSDQDAYTIAQSIVKESGIMAEAYRLGGLDGKDMQDNISELLNAVSSFVESQREEGAGDHVSMSDYLSVVSLLSDTDESKEQESQERVTLMTVHASKGLEYDTVFVVGMEENLFPNIQVLYNPRELEEERRLFYVAITRAKRHCFISCAKSRFHFGQMDMYEPSRFLSELDKRYVKMGDNQEVAFGSSNPYRSTGRLSWNIQDLDRYAPSLSKPRPALNNVSSTSTPSLGQGRKVRISPSAMSDGGTLDFVLIGGMRCEAGFEVEHPRFGIGVVRELKGTPDNCTATIDFRNVGEKHLLLKYAKLKVL